GELQDVVAALKQVRRDDQEVLRLAAWEGLTNAELAVALGCSENAATIRLHRARKRLAEQLAKEEPAAGQWSETSNERTRRDGVAGGGQPGSGGGPGAAELPPSLPAPLGGRRIVVAIAVVAAAVAATLTGVFAFNGSPSPHP